MNEGLKDYIKRRIYGRVRDFADDPMFIEVLLADIPKDEMYDYAKVNKRIDELLPEKLREFFVHANP